MFSNQVHSMRFLNFFDDALTDEMIKANLLSWGYVVDDDQIFSKDAKGVLTALEHAPSEMKYYCCTKAEFEAKGPEA